MPFAEISITPRAGAQTASLIISVKTAGPTTLVKTATANGSIDPLTKLKPWTPIQSFILECELNNHPDKVLVKQLIYDLQRGCAVGYSGPQFANLAKNLPSAYQQPEVIDTTLKKECDTGQLLSPFPSPPLPNFCTSGLSLIPKHDGGWHIIYHLSAPAVGDLQ